MTDFNYKALTLLRNCCMIALPTVYDESLSYYEQLCKITKTVNELVEGMRNIPDYLIHLIREYINGEEFQEIVQDLLTNFMLNVKYPPVGVKAAVGDGNADDSDAFKQCLKYASDHGLSLYVPSGKYLVEDITLLEGASMIGADRYTTTLIKKSGSENPLLTVTTSDSTIANLTLDGNSNSTAEVPVVEVQACASMLLYNLIVTHGDKLVSVKDLGSDIQISNVLFGNAYTTALELAGDGVANVTNCIFDLINLQDGVSYINLNLSDSYVTDCIVRNPNGYAIWVAGDRNIVHMSGAGCVAGYVDAGLKNTIVLEGYSGKRFFAGNLEDDIGGSYTKAVDRAVTENYGGNYSRAVVGNESTGVSGVSSHTYAKDVTDTYSAVHVTTTTGLAKDTFKNSIEKVVELNAKETITGNRTVSVGGAETVSAASREETYTNGKTVKGKNVDVNTTDPIKYRTPSELNDYFNYVPMTGRDGNNYQVLTPGAKFNEIGAGSEGADVNYYDITILKVAHPDWNDDQLMTEAIKEAKKQGKSTVIRWDGEDINPTGSVGWTVTDIGGIDFNGSTINMPDVDFTMFLVNADDAIDQLNVSSTLFDEEGVKASSLFDKVFAINTSNSGNAQMSAGDRMGASGATGDVLYACQLLETNPSGDFINENAHYLPATASSIPCHNVHSYPLIRFTFGNCHVKYDSSTTFPLLLRCRRSNVHVHDITVRGTTNATTYHTGVLAFGAMIGLEISNVDCVNPLADTSGYIVGMFDGVSNIWIHDCNMWDASASSWGAVGGNCLTNMVVERCNISRVDCHYFSWGYYTVRNCRTEYISYGCGVGEITISDCNFTMDYDNNTLYCVRHRHDCVGNFAGTIRVVNCRGSWKDGTGVYIWIDNNAYKKPANATIDLLSSSAYRIMDGCVFSKARRIFQVGNADDVGSYNKYFVIQTELHATTDSGTGALVYCDNVNSGIRALMVINCGVLVDIITNVNCTQIKLLNTLFNTNPLRFRNCGNTSVYINTCHFVSIENLALLRLMVIGCFISANTAPSFTNIPRWSCFGNITNPAVNMDLWNTHS